MQNVLHVLRTIIKVKPGQYADTYPINWALYSLHMLPFSLSPMHTETLYVNFSVRASPVLTSVPKTQVHKY